MSWIYHNGIRVWIENGSSPGDYHGLINTATAEMIQFRETWGNDETFSIRRKGNLYRLERINGEDAVVMGPVPRVKIPVVTPFPHPDDQGAMPVPAYDLFNVADRTEFIGWYVNPSMVWDNPIYFLSRDDDFPWKSHVYDEPGGQFDSGKRIGFNTGEEMSELYVLPEIGTEDTATEDGTSEYEKVARYGYEENVTHPCDYIFNVVEGDWKLTAYSATWADVKNLNTGLTHRLLMYATCMRNPAIAIVEDSVAHHHWMSVKIEDQASGRIYPPAGMMVYTERWTAAETYSVSAPGGGVVATGSSSQGGFMQSVGNHTNCDSSTVIEDEGAEAIPSLDESASTVGVEGYGDHSAWIVTWHTWNTALNDKRDCTPWVHEPYNQEMEPPPLQTITQTYHVAVGGPDGSFQFEYADPTSGTLFGGGNYDAVSVWRVRIFDFHGTPVFTLTWHDERDDSANYAMIYQGEIYKSAPFSPTTWGNQMHHDVYDSENEVGGNAYIMGSAIGLRSYTDDIEIYDEADDA